MSRLSVPDFAPLPLPSLPDPAAATFFQSSAADDLDSLDASLTPLDHHFETAADGALAGQALNKDLASSIATGSGELAALIAEQSADSVDAQLADAQATEARLADLADNSDSLLDPAPEFNYRDVPVLDTQPDLGPAPVVITPPPSPSPEPTPVTPPAPAPAPTPCAQGFTRVNPGDPCTPIPVVSSGGSPPVIIGPPPIPPIGVVPGAPCPVPGFVDASGNCVALPLYGICPPGFVPDGVGGCKPIPNYEGS